MAVTGFTWCLLDSCHVLGLFLCTRRVSLYPPSKVSTRTMNLMTGYTVTWWTCVCVCVCVYTVLIQCVCNRFLCKWLNAWSSPMLFAYDPVYNVCIVMRWEVILPIHTGVESSKVTCYQLHTHTHTPGLPTLDWGFGVRYAWARPLAAYKCRAKSQKSWWAGGGGGGGGSLFFLTSNILAAIFT